MLACRGGAVEPVRRCDQFALVVSLCHWTMAAVRANMAAAVRIDDSPISGFTSEVAALLQSHMVLLEGLHNRTQRLIVKERCHTHRSGA